MILKIGCNHAVARGNHGIDKQNNPKALQQEKPVIGFVSLMPYSEATAEVVQAYDLLRSFHEYSAEFITINDLPKQLKKRGRFSLIWIHRPDTSSLSTREIDEKMLKPLKSYVESGGKLLLTLQAAHYLNVLGFEPEKLQDSTKPCTDEGYGRRMGFHAFRQHPLFEGLNGGAYICRPLKDTLCRITGYFGKKVPQYGKVVAVDWDYIFLREDSKLVFEYAPGNGKVVAVGGYMNYNCTNTNSAHLALFTRNCLNYLLRPNPKEPGFYWKYEPQHVVNCPAVPETDRLLVAVPPAVKWEVQSSDIDLRRRFATENFWDVAGERLLTMGNETGGIDEVWAHPFMAFRDYEVGIRFAYKDTVYWLNDERPEVSVHPACFARQYKFRRAYLQEFVVNDPTTPNGVVHYEYRGVYPAQLVIRFKSNLRWMWPYSERVTGSVCHAWDPDLDAILIRDQSGDLNVMIGGNKKPSFHLSGQFEGFEEDKNDSSFRGMPTSDIQVSGLLCYRLEENDNLDVIFSASFEGYDSTYVQFNRTLHDPLSVYRNALQHANEVLSKSLMISTPDEDFNAGYRWAILAADRFFVNTPGMGKALVAGYSTTKHGWDGNHKVNGRPGYGWYFGRDAEWSSFAMLDYGDFGKVKSQLEFFNKFQDLNGKIFHEASTSGLIHYDAADATPLYIVLAGKYFRHTNDTAFLRQTWPNIKRAINFCYSTDTDQDHLIENTNVGHGWVEGGELYGSHATIYMAGSWGAALREASNMATFMNDNESESYHIESLEQQRQINENFWSNETSFFAYGKNKDGLFRREQTILPAVPIYFGMAEPEKSSLFIKNISGNVFSTNWGARILREDSPWFNPTGYHYGSVWPLFTGWAALAEYSTGHSVQGYSHLMNNLLIYKNWGLGFVEEVLNGAEYKPSGVCAHQCWSETMVLQPAIEGMLGLEIKAQEHKIRLSPKFPPQWNSIDVRHILMAEQSIAFNFLRSANGCVYEFSLDQGTPVQVEFMPNLPAGTKISSVTLDGMAVPFTSFKTTQSMVILVSFELRSASKLVVETSSGISILPVVSYPKPGDAAQGVRIISSNLAGNIYMAEVEGKSKSSAILEFWSGGGPLVKADNARFLEQKGSVSRFAVDFEQSGSKYVNKTVTINLGY